MRVWQAHKAKIETLAFSADGQWLATGTGGTVAAYLWDVSTGKLARKVKADWAHGFGQVQSVGFAAGAPLMAVGTSECTGVFDTRTWEPLADLGVNYAYEVAFSGGEAPVLAASNPINVGLWAEPARPTDEEIRTPDIYVCPKGGVSAADLSPDGSLLATTNCHEAGLWDASTGQGVCALPRPHSNHRGAVRFSPDGEKLALARGKWVDIWLLGDDAPRLSIHADKSRSPAVWAVGWADAGRVLLTAGTDGCARFWDAASGAELRSFAWDIGRVFCAAFAPDGLTCAAGGDRGQVVVWDVDV